MVLCCRVTNSVPCRDTAIWQFDLSYGIKVRCDHGDHPNTPVGRAYRCKKHQTSFYSEESFKVPPSWNQRRVFLCCRCGNLATYWKPGRCPIQTVERHFRCEAHKKDNTWYWLLGTDDVSAPDQKSKVKDPIPLKVHPKGWGWGEGPTGDLEKQAMKRFEAALPDTQPTLDNLTLATEIAFEMGNGEAIATARLFGAMLSVLPAYKPQTEPSTQNVSEPSTENVSED